MSMDIMGGITDAAEMSSDAFISGMTSGSSASMANRALMLKERAAPLEQDALRWQNQLLAQKWAEEEQRRNWFKRFARAFGGY